MKHLEPWILNLVEDVGLRPPDIDRVVKHLVDQNWSSALFSMRRTIEFRTKDLK